MGNNCSDSENAVLLSINPSAIFNFIGVRILPNTGMEDFARREGIFKSGDELLFPIFYLSKEVESWLGERIKQLSESDSRWLRLKIE